MKARSTMMKLVPVVLVALTFGTACQKKIDAPSTEAAGRSYYNGPSLALENWRYPIINRDNQEIGYFTISADKGGIARVTLEGLPSSLFWGTYPVEAKFYRGNALYITLNTPTSDAATWTTFPVRDVSGNAVYAYDLKSSAGTKLMLAVPGEVAGRGTIN